MPKLKTNRAAAKRFKATKNGGFKRGKAFGRHLKTVKSAKRRRAMRTAGMLDSTEMSRVKKMLPYS